ncbi:MAG: FG-GAP repeat domain-containing protein [Flavobacteriaceae bacterium]
MLYRHKPGSYFVLIFLTTLIAGSCSAPTAKNEQALYSTHCGSCHLSPNIEDLPKGIWSNNILPDMAARMGIRENGYNPLKGFSFDEMEAAIKTEIYSPTPSITEEDWIRLREYILMKAPDSLSQPPAPAYTSLSDFVEKPMALDSIQGSKNITYLNYREETNNLITADLRGDVLQYDFNSNTGQHLGNFINPVIGYSETPLGTYVTSIGQLSPTQIPTGRLYLKGDDSFKPVAGFLHRPVHMLVEDLDKDGDEEVVVSEFGDLVGQLSLLVKKEGQEFNKQILLNQPGSIRVISRDMNGDERTDLVVLTAQGDEGIIILYQEAPLQFRAERVLRFSPVYGTSWFDLMDYDGDGDEDIITVNGDNADKSYVHKPYHGFRIHLNKGQNKFEEAFFYPLHGATRVLGRDFDQDGDMDFCLVATFPDYDKKPYLPFVYLKNENSTEFKFSSQILQRPSLGRWLLLEAGDIDKDGDEDVVLSSFNYVFTPVPDSLNRAWNQDGTDLLILENKLTENE